MRATRTSLFHKQDILKFQLNSLEPAPHSLRVIGNLPYNISTPVLFHLLRFNQSIDDMVFMLQLEVVQRMAAGVGDKELRSPWTHAAILLRNRASV